MSSSSSTPSATGTAPPTSAPLLAAPLKSTSEVHWERPLSSYISSAYGDDPSKYAREIAAMHKLRQDMRGAGSTADATGRDVLLKYYGQLELFELHFPVDEGTVEIPFEWFDAFTQEPTTQSSLAFEKACVIYNLASTLSRLAASSPRDIKRAYHHLQVAAGLFKFINDNFLHAPSRDLSRESIKFLSDLMHAQAQEILLEKTLADKHGKVTKMAAKIAAGLAHLYAQVSAQCQSGTNLGMYMDSGERVIALTCAVKAKLYLAHAAMHRATLAEAEAQYGEVVARLAAAMADAKDAERWAKQ
ncbi:BRO1 domain-containing protein, partial [Catenaria anguillulae PL171]